jgi:hypothetical protein
MLITEEIRKTKKAIEQTNSLWVTVHAMASENEEAKIKLLKKIEAIETDLRDGLSALKELHS